LLTFFFPWIKRRQTYVAALEKQDAFLITTTTTNRPLLQQDTRTKVHDIDAVCPFFATVCSCHVYSLSIDFEVKERMERRMR
jgi:hypothetical protein